jgi:hypothetical protein
MSGMIGRRDKSWRRFGTLLASLALYMQLAFASWGALATQPEPADAFAEHALCLAAQDGSSRPADPAPSTPTHHHAASCCLWHQFPGLEPVATPTPQAVPHASVTRLGLGEATFTPGPRHSPANARAPPAPT